LELYAKHLVRAHGNRIVDAGQAAVATTHRFKNISFRGNALVLVAVTRRRGFCTN
jgi:hypothetical protein